MLRKTKIGVLLLVFICCFSGCTSEDSRERDPAPSVSTSLQELTEESILGRYQSAQDITFQDYKTLENLHILAVTFLVGSDLHYGFSVIKQQDGVSELTDLVETPRAPEEGINQLQYAASIPEREDRSFFVLCGYANDENIHQVLIYDSESSVVAFQLDSMQRFFITVSSSSDYMIKKIEGRSPDNAVLFEQSW